MLHVGKMGNIEGATATGLEQGSDRLVGFSDAVAFLNRQLWVILASIALAGLLAAAYIATAPKYFSATARILIDPRRVPHFDQVQRDTMDEATAESQVEILTSTNVLLPVIRKLELAEDNELLYPPQDLYSKALSSIKTALRSLYPTTRPQPRPEDQVSLAIIRVSNNLQVRRIGLSLVLSVSYQALQPSKAVEIVNAIADSYIQEQVNARVDAYQQSAAWMQHRLEELRSHATAAARAVQDFKSEHEIVDTARGSIDEQVISEVTSQLVLVRTQANEAAARLRRVTDILDSDAIDGTVADALRIDVVNHLRQQLLDASMRESDVVSKFGYSHPAAVRAREEIAQLKQSLRSELERVAETFKSDLQIATSRQEALEKHLSEVIKGQSVTNQARARLRELESIAQTYSTVFESTLRRQMEISEQHSQPVTEARIITRGTLPLTNDYPRSILVLTFSLFGGAFIGIGAAFLRDSRDPVFRTAEDLESFTKLRCLATVPCLQPDSAKLMGEAGKIPLPMARPSSVAADSHAAFVESITSLRVAITLADDRRTGVVVGITSVVPGEGTSTVAANLALSFAQSGARCLLVDANMHCPALTQLIAPSGKADLFAILTGAAATREFVTSDLGAGLSFVPTRRAAPPLDASGLLSSQRMQRFLEEAAERFDYVVLDMPAIGPYVDVRAASHYVEKFIVAVAWGSTERELVRRALERNAPERSQIIGLVLTKVPLRVLGRYRIHRLHPSLARKVLARLKSGLAKRMGFGAR